MLNGSARGAAHSSRHRWRRLCHRQVRDRFKAGHRSGVFRVPARAVTSRNSRNRFAPPQRCPRCPSVWIAVRQAAYTGATRSSRSAASERAMRRIMPPSRAAALPVHALRRPARPLVGDVLDGGERLAEEAIKPTEPRVELLYPAPCSLPLCRWGGGRAGGRRPSGTGAAAAPPPSPRSRAPPARCSEPSGPPGGAPVRSRPSPARRRGEPVEVVCPAGPHDSIRGFDARRNAVPSTPTR